MIDHLTPSDFLAPHVADVIDQLKQLLVSKINPNLKLEEIDSNALILEDELGLDSIMVVEFIILLEKNFGFVFAENDLSMDAFANLQTLAAFIVHKNSSV